MKARFFALMALVLGLASCQTDMIDGVKVDANGEAAVTIQVGLPQEAATRAAGTDSAKGAIDNGIDLENTYDIRYILEVYDANGNLAKEMEKFEHTSTETKFELRLVPGRHYRFVVWADFVKQGTEGPLHYDASDLRDVKLVGDIRDHKPMDESRDAYTGVFNTADNGGSEFSSTTAIDITLTRPFAKLRVVTNDMKELYSDLKTATVKYSTPIYSAFNALNAKPVADRFEYNVEKNVDYSTMCYENEANPRQVGGVQTLFADYLFGTEYDVISFTLDVKDGVAAIPTIEFNTSIPVQRNFLTTVMGPILTDPNNITVIIDSDFAGEKVVDIWDGESKTEPDFKTDDTTGETVAVIDSASDLAWLADFVNNGMISSFATRANNGVNFVLKADIDLDNMPWTPIGTSENNFVGTFDGNGHSIKNLNIVVTEAKEGKAYMGFLGYAKNAIIKNVVFENAYVNVECLDIDHSQGHIGAVVGSLEGTSTIENVTVKGDVQVYTTQDANGASRVAVIAGGNAFGDVTMKNVHVVANEGSSLIANNNVGALAGQLQGKMVFENCSSNINVTANKFFAGGLVGIAAGDSYIKNCHTTGNVSVVAGREGRHNDEYRVGGIAGGWADGKTKVFTLEGCTYSGEVSGKNSDGTVAEPLDYAGYVGRGYTLTNCAGSKVIIDGVAYIQKYDNVYGVYVNENGYDHIADGLCKNDKEYVVLSANGLVALAEQGLKAGDKVLLGANIDLAGVEFNGLDTFHPENNNTFDGQNFTVSNWTNNSGASDMGFIRNWVGTIKNVKFENCHLKTSGRSAIAAAKVYGNIENVTINNCSLEDSYWACGLVAGLYNAGNISGCTVTNSSIKSNGGTGAIVGVINESAGTRKVENCKVEGCTVNNTGAYGETYSGALICGMINISDSTVEFNSCSFANNSKEGKYVGDLYYSADDDITVKIDGGIVVNTVEEFTAALKDADVDAIVLGQDITVTEKWDNRYTGAKTTKEITINGNGHTLKFACEVSDGFNYQAAFRFEAPAVVKNLTIDMSEVPGTGTWLRAISTKGDITVDNCTFIGNTNYTSGRGIAYGEGAGAAASDIVVSVTNSTFTNWTRRGLTDNENAQDAKDVTVTKNTFTNADCYVSAHDSIVFTGNVMNNSAANFRTYSNATDATVVATDNTLDANNDNNVIRGFVATNVSSQEGFNII